MKKTLKFYSKFLKIRVKDFVIDVPKIDSAEINCNISIDINGIFDVSLLPKKTK